MRSVIKTIILIILLAGSYTPALAQSMDKITLSITPPLIKNNVSPGQVWQSAIKVVNNNPVEIDVYIEVADFKGGTETGTVTFIQAKNNTEEDQSFLASTWINISSGPITIPAFKGKDIPFIVEVPETADPGGHYVSLLAGTKPPDDGAKGSAIKISSLLASLIFLNVSGEVEESGRIREFSLNKKVFNKPEVDFVVRFENTGNVHIQPQGEIRIYNFFNNIDNSITINHSTEFGNVLPGGIRKWEFNWQGKDSILSMGRYRAELVLGYGETSRETVEQTLYFWVIYFKELLIALGSLTLFVLLIVLTIKRYIKRAIVKTQAQAGLISSPIKPPVKTNAVNGNKNIVNLRSKALRRSSNKSFFSWRLFKIFIFLILLILIMALIGLYFYNAKTNEKNNSLQTETLVQPKPKPEKIKPAVESVPAVNKDEAETNSEQEATTTGEASENTGSTTVEDGLLIEKPEIVILNGSGKAGMANLAAEELREQGYTVSRVGNADNYNYINSVIKYQVDYSQEARIIKNFFSSPIEIETDEKQTEKIIIIIGNIY